MTNLKCTPQATSTMKTAVVWNVSSCSLVEVSQRYVIRVDKSRSLWFHAFCVGLKLSVAGEYTSKVWTSENWELKKFVICWLHETVDQMKDHRCGSTWYGLL